MMRKRSTCSDGGNCEWICEISIQLGFLDHLRLGQERPTTTTDNDDEDHLVVSWESLSLISIVQKYVSSLLLCGALIKSCFNSFDLYCNYPIMYANFLSTVVSCCCDWMPARMCLYSPMSIVREIIRSIHLITNMFTN